MRERSQKGFSVGELLVVVAVLGLIVAIGIPLVSEQIRTAKIRGAADQFSMALKAVRMIAVSKRTNPITFNFNGSVDAQATTVFEANLSAGAVERWTITTSLMGVTSIDHVRQ